MITTDRNKLVGGHLTEEEKDLVRQDANRENLSVSKWLHRVVRRELKNKGYELQPESK